MWAVLTYRKDWDEKEFFANPVVDRTGFEDLELTGGEIELSK